MQEPVVHDCAIILLKQKKRERKEKAEKRRWSSQQCGMELMWLSSFWEEFIELQRREFTDDYQFRNKLVTVCVTLIQ